MIARLRGYLVSGFFTLIPLGLSVAVMIWFARLIDSSLSPVAYAFVGRKIPGLGVAAALGAVLLAGWLASNVIGERLLSVAERALHRIPVFKSVYGTVKQMVDAFSPENKASFKSVVVVEHPRPGAFSMGFVTNETVLRLPDGSEKAMLAVYVPTNHVYFGDIVLLPKDAVYPTGLTVPQGIQCSLSAGAAFPGHLGPDRRARKR